MATPSGQLRRALLASCCGVASLPAMGLARDPACPEAACCSSQERSENCEFSEAATRAYCCPNGPRSACYLWDAETLQPPMTIHRSVASGVQCRHLCQADEACSAWTYFVNASSSSVSSETDEENRATCHLHAASLSSSSTSGRMSSSARSVSGSRFCKEFADTWAPRDLQVVKDFAAAPWRTLPFRSSAEAAEATGVGGSSSSSSSSLPLLPLAGTQNWHFEAAAVFNDLGFVAILEAVDQQRTDDLRAVAEAVAADMLRQDPERVGNRGPRRYSYGGASNTQGMMHLPAWSSLLDLPALQQVLDAIFGGAYYASGAGGDFVLGNTDVFQTLHLDVGGGPVHWREKRRKQVKRPATYNASHVETPPPAVVVNVILEDLACDAGPVRVLPHTHLRAESPPALFEERLEDKATLLCPLPAGSVVVRDMRAWHGGRREDDRGDGAVDDSEHDA
eukprot:TRINITY_DN18797_c0_g1_i2.p1 TRINITY_DN18797_c0_g1~~TRINITY_DN18797_c0_g1_i2.p1  ORF type:complete len:451 (-),score=105.62 TRINITY_DN18797_c0_g1_i2:72-1424(-)